MLAYGINLGDQALQEKRLFTARQAFGGQDWLGDDVGEKAIREYLSHDEANPEALMLLARKLSQYSTSEEGRELYQKAIDLQIKTDITEALSYYREYFNKYLRPLRPDLQIRMAVIAEKEGDNDFAARSLESLLKDPTISLDMREKCLFHCSRIYRKMGLIEAADMYAEKFTEIFLTYHTIAPWLLIGEYKANINIARSEPHTLTNHHALPVPLTQRVFRSGALSRPSGGDLRGVSEIRLFGTFPTHRRSLKQLRVRIPEQNGHRFRCKVGHLFRGKLDQSFRYKVGH